MAQLVVRDARDSSKDPSERRLATNVAAMENVMSTKVREIDVSTAD